MSYYFPFGGGDAVALQNISYSLFTTTASVPLSNISTMALTASYAVDSGSTPYSGVSGITVTEFACIEAANSNPKLLVSGTKGLQGDTGSNGQDYNICPDEGILTVRCIDLEDSLSMAFPGYPYGLNHTLPSGSRYSIVCMEIPPGCDNTVLCPPFLPVPPTQSLPAIP